MAQQPTRDELAKWFADKAIMVSGETARTRIFAANNRAKNTVFAGKLYVFKYDAKTKEKLEMWDKYPMSMILERRKDSFLGLNLHYLPKQQRMTLLNGFNKYQQDYGATAGTTTGKGVTNWDLLLKSMSASNLQSLPKKCLKRYLFGHVRSKFIPILPDEFDKAILLPIDVWVFKNR